MTEDQIIAAALRNRANRAGQVERLTPARAEAREKAQALRGAVAQVREARDGHMQMRSLRQIPNFFPTPPRVIERMLRAIEIPLGPDSLATDPNAGKGNLLEALRPFGCRLKGYEIVSVLAEIVRKKGFDCETVDFLTVGPDRGAERPDLVFMNPPFERGVDRKHIQHAFELLRREPGRRCQLIAVCSQPTGIRLRDWADFHGGYVEDLPDRSFANSDNQTLVRTALVSIAT